MQCIPLREEMRQHHDKRDGRTDGRGKPRAIRAHIACKDKEIIPKHIENAARQHSPCGQRGVFIVPQVGRKHLVEQEQRDCKFDGAHVFPRQRKRVVLRAKQQQEFAVEKDHHQPNDRRKKDRADHGSGKIRI